MFFFIALYCFNTGCREGCDKFTSHYIFQFGNLNLNATMGKMISKQLYNECNETLAGSSAICLLFRGKCQSLRGCGIGRANKLLPISIGGIIPGVSLNNERVPSHAQMTPKDDDRQQK